MTTIHHDENDHDRGVMKMMRQELANHPPIVFKPETRPVFDEIMGRTPPPSDVAYQAENLGGVAGWWCRPKNAVDGRALFYLHGGGYVMGSASAYRHFVGHVATAAQSAAFVPDYRLAPEHPFPAAVDDAVSTYRALARGGFDAIALAGDSAGGGLALVLLSLMSSAGHSLGGGVRPSAAAVMSPWTDLALTGASFDGRANADPLLNRESLQQAAQQYLRGRDPRDAPASPLYGDLRGLPPVLLHVGEDEVLLDDSRRYVEKLDAAGGTSQLHVWAGMVHVFPSNIGVLRSATEALDRAGGFLRDSWV